MIIVIIWIIMAAFSFYAGWALGRFSSKKDKTYWIPTPPMQIIEGVLPYLERACREQEARVEAQARSIRASLGGRDYYDDLYLRNLSNTYFQHVYQPTARPFIENKDYLKQLDEL